jgi:hypothetical protein
MPSSRKSESITVGTMSPVLVDALRRQVLVVLSYGDHLEQIPQALKAVHSF